MDFEVENGPFLKSKNKTSKMMLHLFIALLPIIIFSFYKNGIIPYQKGLTDIKGLLLPLMVIILPTLTSFLTEILYATIFLKKDGLDYVKNSFSIFPGLFFGLIMPLNTPFSMLILGAFIATFIGKIIFGGFGNNVFNPALIGRLFIITAYSATLGGYIYHNAYELDTIASSTPLSNAGVISGIGSYQTLVKPYGNLMNFFIGTIPGAVGETSALLCLVAFLYLTITKTIKWRIPVFYISTVFIMSFIIGAFNDLERTYSLFQILSGGLMFGAVFMATDPVTSPTTFIGQVLYGISLGILTVVFRNLTSYPEGVLTSILTMNMLVFIIDSIGVKSRFNKKYAVPFFVILITLSLTLSCYIGLRYKNVSTDVDNDFQIYSKTIDGDTVTYMAGEKGYSSILKAKIIIKNNKVTDMVVLEQNDSYYSKVENENYINSLIKNQESLDNFDTIAGCTFTSNGLKKMLINTLNDYKNNKNEEIKGNVEIESDFEVLDKSIDGNIYTYIVSKKSFSGKMKLKISIVDSYITNVIVLEQNDSYYNKILESDYVNYLINNQKNLDNVDTVAGATISSNSFKKAIEETLKQYKEDINVKEN